MFDPGPWWRVGRYDSLRTAATVGVRTPQHPSLVRIDGQYYEALHEKFLPPDAVKTIIAVRRDDDFAAAAVRYGMTVCDRSCTCKVPEDKPCGEEDTGVGDGGGDGDGANAVNVTGGLRLNDGAGGGTGVIGAPVAEGGTEATGADALGASGTAGGTDGVPRNGFIGEKQVVSGKTSAAGGGTQGDVGAFVLAANDVVAKLDKSRRDAAEAKSVEAAAAGVAKAAAAAAAEAAAEVAEVEAAEAAAKAKTEAEAAAAAAVVKARAGAFAAAALGRDDAEAEAGAYTRPFSSST
jgi:hypothetical protein